MTQRNCPPKKRMLWAPEFECDTARNDPAIGIQCQIKGKPALSAKDHQAFPLAKAERFT